MGKSLVLFLFLHCIMLQGLLADPTEEELLAWKAPEGMIKDCPYYLLSYDFGSPLWLIPFGAWDYKEHITKNEKDLSKYIDQGVARAIVSGRNNTGFMMIVDLGGTGPGLLGPLTNYPFFVSKTLAMLKTFEATEMKFFWLINADAKFKAVIEGLMSPIFGGKILTFTKKEVEEAKKSLRGKIHEDNLPEKYGGVAEFNPVQTHG